MASSRRQEKIAEHVRHLAAEFFGQHAPFKDVLVTVTRADVSPDLRASTIYISTIPTERQSEVLAELEKQLAPFREFFKKNFEAKVLPFFKLQIDYGERNRQSVDNAMREN